MMCLLPDPLILHGNRIWLGLELASQSCVLHAMNKKPSNYEVLFALGPLVFSERHEK